MIQGFYSQYEYQISFLIGIVAILYFCHRQINAPLKDLVTEKFAFADAKGPRSYVGRGLLNEAVFYLFILVSISYATICFSEAIYKFVFIDNVSGGSNPAPAFDRTSGTWPLTVAVIIVGLSADFPLLKEVELAFRRIARKAAGIPDNFLTALQNVKNFDFTTLSIQSDEAWDTYEEVTILHFYDCIRGVSRTDAANNRERLFRALMLERWIFSETAGAYWTIEGLSKARAASTLSSEEVSKRIEDLRTSIKAIKDTDFYRALISILNSSDIDKEARESSLLFKYEFRDNEEIQALWEQHGKRLTANFDQAAEKAIKILSTIDDMENGFAVLFLNDGANKRVKDNALAKVFDHVSSFQSQVHRNIIVWIIVWSIVNCMIFTTLFYFFREYVRPEQAENPVDLIQVALRIGGQHSIGIFVIVAFSILGASIFERVTSGSRISSRSADGVAPILYYLGVMISALFLAYFAQAALWAVSNLQPRIDWGVFIKDARSFLPDVLIWTMFGSVFSVCLIVWLKRIEADSLTMFHEVSGIKVAVELVLVAITCFVVPLVGYLIFHEDRGSQILQLYGEGNKLLKLSLAFLTPLIVLSVVSVQLRRVSRLRVGFK